MFQKFFAKPATVDFDELIKQGAIVIDVRSEREFMQGHLKGSVNIPLQNLTDQISKFQQDKPIILCCASGARSSLAKKILKAHGFTEVYNAGSWINLKKR